MFLIEPKEVRDIDKLTCKKLSNTLRIICWAYMDWQEQPNLASIRVEVQIAYQQWRPPFVQINYHPVNRKKSAILDYAERNSQLKEVFSKILQPVYMQTCPLNLEALVPRPTPFEELLAVGSYKPVFESLINASQRENVCS